MRPQQRTVLTCTGNVRLNYVESADQNSILVGTDEDILVENKFVHKLVLVVVNQSIEIHDPKNIPARKSNKVLMCINLSDFDIRIWQISLLDFRPPYQRNSRNL